MKDHKGIICLMGATASGKTELAVELAKHLPIEIISVDSGMIYRGMDIGTAKPTAQQLAAAPHHLINICDPSEVYSAAKFREDALKEIENIFSRGKIPLCIGGTMLYFKILQEGISVLPKANSLIRAQILREAEFEGWDKLYQRLEKIDPDAAAKIARNDLQRVQRALEIYELSGEAMSKLVIKNLPQPLPYKVINLMLNPFSKEQHLFRINARLQEMLYNGFLDEVSLLLKREDLHYDLPSMRTVGYRQVLNYLKGEIDYQSMQQQIITATRHLAKRQFTWLRRKGWQNAIWIDNDGKDNYSCLTKFVSNVVDSLLNIE